MSKFTQLLWLLLVIAGCAAAADPTPTPITDSAQTTPTLAIDPADITFVDADALPTSTFEDPRLRQAEADYQVYCAHCHGYEGEGQAVGAPGETARLGYKQVPPHDSTGEIWHYADPLLFEVIKFGINNPLDHYPMIGFDAALSDDRIMALVDYIKFWWTEEQRTYQAEVTANYIQARTEAGSPIYPLDATEEAAP
ncbi:MAG: cytochrome c [Anaerolineae bacterium]|nr:cytochrome c [Anaerolineae bacterium]